MNFKFETSRVGCISCFSAKIYVVLTQCNSFNETIQMNEESFKQTMNMQQSHNTIKCLSIGTPKNYKFSICHKWKINIF